MNPPDQPTTDTENRIDDFMVAEFNMIESVRENLLTEGESRGNFFLAIVSGSLIAIGLLTQSGLSSDFSTAAAFIILTILVVIGFSTFNQSVRRNYRLIFYTHGLNRIRHYFVELKPSIQKYLILSITDDNPPYRVQVGDQCQLISVINSALLCTLVAGAILKFSPYPLLFVVLVGVLVGLGSYFAHHLVSSKLARNWNYHHDINFPTSKTMLASGKPPITLRRTKK
jgi:hypothetical protein